MSATALASGTEMSDASQLLALLDRVVDAGKHDGAGEVDDCRQRSPGIPAGSQSCRGQASPTLALDSEAPT